jgi:MoxR-like ATPase
VGEFGVASLQAAADADGLRFPEFVIQQLVAAINAGKHVILTGPPGTGKTSLAFLAAEVGQRSLL